MKFYVGMHVVSQAIHVDRAFISVNRLRGRLANFATNAWIMDSGAFTEVSTYGRYRDGVNVYAHRIAHWARASRTLECAVSQDFMCEPFVLEKTGGSLQEHQRWTIERYDDLMTELGSLGCALPIMPVLQGWTVEDYVRHLWDYGGRLREGQRVGVGSVCKRNSSDPKGVRNILAAIHAERPDLKLHGFGLKTSTLKDSEVRALLYSSDSMAWSFAARREGRNANDWNEARLFEERINALCQGAI